MQFSGIIATTSSFRSSSPSGQSSHEGAAGFSRWRGQVCKNRRERATTKVFINERCVRAQCRILAYVYSYAGERDGYWDEEETRGETRPYSHRSLAQRQTSRTSRAIWNRMEFRGLSRVKNCRSNFRARAMLRGPIKRLNKYDSSNRFAGAL